MEKHESTKQPADSKLPRPVVLSVEELASVAAAGAMMSVSQVVTGKVLIAGGISVGGPYMV